LTQQHRGLSAEYLGGNDSARAAREQKRAETEAAADRFAASVAALGDARLAALAARLKGDFQAIAAGVEAKSLSAGDSFTRHTTLVTDELTALDGITDVSGLILDPQPETYYLVTATFVYLPSLTEALGQARARGTLLLARGEARPEERAQLSALGDIARLHLASARSAFERSAAADSALKQALERPTTAALEGAEGSLKLADERIVRTDKLSYPPGDFRGAMTQGIDAQFALIDAASGALGAALHERIAATRHDLITLGAAMAALGALALWIGVILARSVSRSIGDAVRIAQTVAAGDLTSRIEVTARDETGELLSALKAMNEGLVGVVGRVRQSADTIGHATRQIAAGNQDLSSRTEEQASSLEETASSMEELTSTVKQNADSARQANALAGAAAQTAEEGGRTVSGVVGTMQEIAASSNRIQDIIQVIDGIAFQTNILALNAAVEAARAGEQGRGFAVVASEVRGLAQRSASAAKEIKELIGASVARVAAGDAQVDAAGTQMTEMVASVKRVTDVISEISAASSEQASGIEQVSLAISQMDQVTQQNAALVEEAAAAAESLSQEARSLIESVSLFKLPPGGAPVRETAAGAAPAPRAAPVPSAAPVPRARAKEAAAGKLVPIRRRTDAARAPTAAAAPAVEQPAAPQDAAGGGEWATF